MAIPRSEADERVTNLELFFDLVFVFAITQVTALMAKDPTWGGVGEGMLVLSALWFAWASFAWLTNTLNPEEGGVRLAIFATMAALLVASLAVPGAFDDDGVIFGVAYLIVRSMHPALYLLAHIAFRLRNVGAVNRQRLFTAGVLAALIPVARELDALPALAITALATCGLIAYEAIRFREVRDRVRHAQEVLVS